MKIKIVWKSDGDDTRIHKAFCDPRKAEAEFETITGSDHVNEYTYWVTTIETADEPEV